MNNKITIDIDAIMLLPDNSITDPETIRQIALYLNKYGSDVALASKIKRGFEFAGLYPEVHSTKLVVDAAMRMAATSVRKYSVPKKSELHIFYDDLQTRLVTLEGMELTGETQARISELTAIIVRVQQMRLAELNVSVLNYTDDEENIEETN